RRRSRLAGCRSHHSEKTSKGNGEEHKLCKRGNSFPPHHLNIRPEFQRFSSTLTSWQNDWTQVTSPLVRARGDLGPGNWLMRALVAAGSFGPRGKEKDDARSC